MWNKSQDTCCPQEDRILLKVVFITLASFKDDHSASHVSEAASFAAVFDLQRCCSHRTGWAWNIVFPWANTE